MANSDGEPVASPDQHRDEAETSKGEAIKPGTAKGDPAAEFSDGVGGRPDQLGNGPAVPEQTEAQRIAELERRETQLAAEERRQSERAASLDAASRAQPHHRLRRSLVVVLVVLTSIGVLVSTITDWSHQVVLNTDRFVATLTPVTSDPLVLNGVSQYIANQAVAELKIQQKVAQRLPANQQFLAGPITSVLHDLLVRSSTAVMSSNAFQKIWTRVLTTTHSKLVALLRGDTKNVVIEGNSLKLNAYPVMVGALSKFQSLAPGLIKTKAPLPTEEQATSPTVARQQLSKALGVQLPDSFGEITIAQSNQLDKAQQAVKLFDFLAIALPVLTLVLGAAAIWFSLNRRHTVLWLGIGAAVAFLLAFLLGKAFANRAYAGLSSNPPANDIIKGTLPTLLNSLVNITILLTVIGILVAIAAYLAGEPRWFTRLIAHIQRRGRSTPRPA